MYAVGAEAEKTFVLQSEGALVGRINPTGKTQTTISSKKRNYVHFLLLILLPWISGVVMYKASALSREEL